MDSSSLSSIIPKDIKSDFDSMIGKYPGSSVYLVGGSVRDFLLDKIPKDLDFCVAGIPMDTMVHELRSLDPHAKLCEVGQAFGVLKYTKNNIEYDIALPRFDKDRHVVTCDHTIPIEKDLIRRDFTCNAMAYDIHREVLHGPSGIGAISELLDIEQKTIRAVGNPDDRFMEDPLRILRGIQIAARCSFDIEPKTLASMKNNIVGLQNVSSERFREEFIKGFNNPTRFIDGLKKSSVIEFIALKDPVVLPHKTSNKNDFWTSLFIHGGDYKKIALHKEEENYINLARTFYEFARNKNDKNLMNLHVVANRNKARIPEVAESLSLCFPDKRSLFFDIANKPLASRGKEKIYNCELPEDTMYYVEEKGLDKNDFKGYQAVIFEEIRKFQL